MEAAVKSTGEPGAIARIFLSFSARENILLQGAAAVFSRLLRASAKKALSEPSINVLRCATRSGLLATHLWQEGGVTGVTEVTGGSLISSAAGLGAAVAGAGCSPRTARLGELALRLADFSLKGQLPTGFFFENYRGASGAWQGVRGEASRTLLSVSQSSRIAELLLDLAADLAAAGAFPTRLFPGGAAIRRFLFDGKARLLVPGSLRAPRDRTPCRPRAALGGLGPLLPACPCSRGPGATARRRGWTPW